MKRLLLICAPVFGCVALVLCGHKGFARSVWVLAGPLGFLPVGSLLEFSPAEAFGRSSPLQPFGVDSLQDSLQGWESESECRGGLSEGCPEGSLDEKEGFEDHFWYLELKFGVDLLSTGHLSRLFDPATGSIKMRNHFPVILALLILYQLPYGATYFVPPKTAVF